MNRFHSLVVGLVCAACVVVQAQSGLSGKWEGTTPSGRLIVLDVKVNKQELKGRLTVNQQSSDITDGKVEDKTFSFVATVEGRTARFNGRLLREEVELTPEGGPGPVRLKRVK